MGRISLNTCPPGSPEDLLWGITLRFSCERKTIDFRPPKLVCPLHPEIERIVKKCSPELANHTTLRCAAASLSCVPSSCTIDAVSHLSMYSSAHLHVTCFRIPYKSSWSMLSNSPLMSNSRTQSYFQHRSRVTPTASSADFLPVAIESARNTESKSLNDLLDYHLRHAIRYGGTPKILCPPDFLEWRQRAPRRKVVPELILFQIL